MTVFVYYLDEISGPPGTGLDWFHSFYFSYMSFTTIGLGDVMPNNATFAPIVSILFFLGLPIMKVVNRMTYITMENGAFGMLTVIENRIDNYWKGKQPVIAEVETGKIERKTIAAEDSYEIPAEWVNNVTIHSIATFMKSNRDVYGGSFGKVHLRTADVLSPNEQDTVLSRRSHR
uniref:Ion_trans_2 domain-containing protein n=1 Tax=Angiostrongylus cantonensis TaxID=6313 RepID=A0A158PCP9_ANGCA